MFTTKNIYRNSWLLHLIVWLGVFCACTDIDDEPTMVKTRSLTMSRIAIADNVNVQTARVLVFDEYGALVTNIGPISNLEQDANNDNILNINTTNETDKILAKVGKNSVYVVLNEAAGITTDESNNVTWNLTAQLNAVKTKTEMETLRNTPIEYKEVIAVEGDTEPAFLMCVYDDEVIVTNQTETLDLTGLDEGDYGFSMRRSMAKIILESVTGGIKPDNTTLGTDALIETSAIHILDMELINVPNSFYWNDDVVNNMYDLKPYEGSYLYPASEEGFDLGVSEDGSNIADGYYEREWLGEITVSGTVTFSRTDALASLWKIQANDGGNAYDITPAYIFTQEYAENAKNWSLNMGNFADFYFTKYIKEEHYVPGDYIPEQWLPTAIQVTPATWILTDLNNIAYYIPENITTIRNNQTAIRVTLSIGTPTAYFDNDDINRIIQEAIKNNNYTGGIVGDEEGGIIKVGDKKTLAEFLITKGKPVPDPNGSGNYGITYEGIKSIFRATTEVSNNKGFYAKITREDTPIEIVTVTIPLNNDMVSGGYDNTKYENESNESDPEDHNIYRGREYHVKLYVTKQGAWNNQTNTASRTINIGGEELTIIGKVVTKPMK